MAGKLRGIPITMLGCDLREVDLAIALLGLGVDLRLVGFPETGLLKKASHFQAAQEAVRGCRALIAPMSNTDAAGLIQSRLDDQQGISINLAELIPLLAVRTPLLIGVAKPAIKGLAAQYRLRLVEMAEIDEIAILNSIPTAEGAIQVAMENTNFTLHNSRCLVLGLGRCGTTLVQGLIALGAKVTVGSRSSKDLARALAMHAAIIDLPHLATCADFDLIFNTIPAMVLPRSYLRLLEQQTLIVDLASGPGGTDFAAAEQLGIKVIHALSLPGKVAPKTAGEILVQTIPHLLEKLLGEEYHDLER